MRTLLHVLCHRYDRLRAVAYATARSLQGIQLRDATLRARSLQGIQRTLMLRSQALLLHLRTLVMLRCGRWGLLGLC